MKKLITLLLVNLTLKAAVAVSGNLLVTPDGHVWEVKDELAAGKTYVVLFDTLGDVVVENDEIVRVF